MIASTLSHVTHAAVAALHASGKARSAVPAVLSVAGFTPMQAEMLSTGFALTAQAIMIAAHRVSRARPMRLNRVN